MHLMPILSTLESGRSRNTLNTIGFICHGMLAIPGCSNPSSQEARIQWRAEARPVPGLRLWGHASFPRTLLAWHLWVPSTTSPSLSLRRQFLLHRVGEPVPVSGRKPYPYNQSSSFIHEMQNPKRICKRHGFKNTSLYWCIFKVILIVIDASVFSTC